MYAIPHGLGKEVVIRMIRAVDSLELNDRLQMMVNTPHYASEVQALEMKCMVSNIFLS